MMTKSMTKKTFERIIAVFVCVILVAALSFSTAFADDVPDEEIYEDTTPKGTIYVTDEYELRQAVKGNEQKTIIVTQNIELSRTLKVGNNTTINATGRTIVCNKGAARNVSVKKLNYESAMNIKIIGGTWKSNYKKSLFQFVHAQNISFANAYITCGMVGHAIELIACKNVSIKNCKVIGVGTCPKKCVEEQIQVDLATPKTAPTIPKNMQTGQTCSNVVVDNCVVSGARGVCANHANKEKKFKARFHHNITVKNCKITGVRSEALSLFNSLNIKVLNNKIKSMKKSKKSPYSVGCHVHLFGKIKGKAGNRSVTIKNNTVYGGRQAIYITSHSSSKYSKATVRGNKAHCRAGKKKAIMISNVRKKSIGNNKKYKW